MHVNTHGARAHSDRPTQASEQARIECMFEYFEDTHFKTAVSLRVICWFLHLHAPFGESGMCAVIRM